MRRFEASPLPGCVDQKAEQRLLTGLALCSHRTQLRAPSDCLAGVPLSGLRLAIHRTARVSGSSAIVILSPSATSPTYRMVLLFTLP
jgi:hypothetical protein